MNANWEASHPDTGRPYLQCNPALDVAGAKDLKLYVALTEHIYGVASDLEYNTSTSFSICMAGKTNIRTGITKKYYGRPCNVQGSNVPNVSFSNRAPCVSEKSGKGELCLECPDGKFKIKKLKFSISSIFFCFFFIFFQTVYIY